MERYEEKIENALQLLQSPSTITPTGCNPIVYLPYMPKDVMRVRDLVKSFLPSKANYYGFDVKFVSMGKLVDQFISNHRYLELWQSSSANEIDIYKSIKQEIDTYQYLETELLKIQDESTCEHPLLVICDLEMLHPLHMMGAIENRIYNKIHIPILVLYPGETQGTARSFLNIYNQDGNYRSVNV